MPRVVKYNCIPFIDVVVCGEVCAECCKDRLACRIFVHERHDLRVGDAQMIIEKCFEGCGVIDAALEEGDMRAGILEGG